MTYHFVLSHYVRVRDVLRHIISQFVIIGYTLTIYTLTTGGATLIGTPPVVTVVV